MEQCEWKEDKEREREREKNGDSQDKVEKSMVIGARRGEKDAKKRRRESEDVAQVVECNLTTLSH